MFSADYITLSILYVFISMFLAFSFNEIKLPGKIILLLGLVACLYCILAGFHLLDGWGEPLSGMESGERGILSAKAGGRGGIILLAISLWPYVLIGFGSLFGLLFLRVIFENNTSSNDSNLENRT